MELKNFFKPTWKKIIIFIILVVLLSLTFRLSFGTYPYWSVVSSKAMYPAYNVGDIVFIKNTAFDKLSVSNVVIFDSPETRNPFMMRIISIDKNENTFTTQGDNNPKSLPSEINVSSEYFLGKVVFSIPFVGYPDFYHVGWLIRAILIYILACFISLIPLRKAQ